MVLSCIQYIYVYILNIHHNISQRLKIILLTFVLNALLFLSLKGEGVSGIVIAYICLSSHKS